MHRIDGPGATVDNKFTDGDPVSAIQATVVTDDWLNDVQEELMSLLVAASITPVKGTQDQVLRAIRRVASGVVGQAQNLKASIPTASASAAWSADELIVESALGGLRYCLPSFNKTINLATTGAGGMDTGSAPVNGWVGIYAIYNPTTGASALMGVNSVGAVLPSVYAGANMPAGYTASALISVWGTNASGLLSVGYQRGRKIATALIPVLSGSSLPASYSPIALSSAIPPNATMVSGLLSLQSTTGNGGISISVAADVAGTHRQGINGYTATGANGAGVVAAFTDLVVATQQLLYFNGQVNGPTAYTNIVNTTGYAI